MSDLDDLIDDFEPFIRPAGTKPQNRAQVRGRERGLETARQRSHAKNILQRVSPHEPSLPPIRRGD